MHPEILGEWLRRQGHNVLRTASSYWCDHGPRVYQAFPYHWIIEPNEEELSELLLEQKAIGLRYTAPISAHYGGISYHVVYNGGDYTLDTLSTKSRYKVRKGLRQFAIEPITFSRMAKEGWDVRAETLIRQGRLDAETQPWWQKLCYSAEELPGPEAWGAVDKQNGKLAASLIAFTCDACVSLLYQQSRTDYLGAKVNNALTFAVTNHILNRPGITDIFYSLHSLDAPASVDTYKFRMNYKAKAVRQRVVFHPWLRPPFIRAGHWGARQLLKLSSGNPFLAKAEGFLRLYLEGLRPLCAQTWPPPLIAQKKILLNEVGN